MADQPKKTEVEDLAEKIATSGAAGDEVTSVLAKGVVDAMNGFKGIGETLAGLLKGKVDPLAKAKGDDEDDEDEGDDEGDDKGDGGDGKPGYEDMGKAVPGVQGLGVEPDGTYVLDVTQMLFQLGPRMEKFEKAVMGELGKLRSENQLLAKAILQSSETSLAAVLPLAKAAIENRESALQVAAPGITPKNEQLAPKRLTVLDEARIGGDERTEKIALAKAMNQGVIDNETFQAFRKTRRFDADDAKNTAVRKQIEALAPVPAATA